MKTRYIFYVGILILLLNSCKDKVDTGVISNYSRTGTYNDTIIFFDYESAYENGFAIPSVNQSSDGKFTFSFKIANLNEKENSFAYKVYYQNESYKFSESKGLNKYNELSSENFYGSYQEVTKGFKTTASIKSAQEITVIDSIKIIGNPRNEVQYISNETHLYKGSMLSEEEIQAKVNEIKGNKEWLESILKKATANSIDIEKQLYDDAKWILEEKKILTNRWQRNPRVGQYSLLIVVTDLENLQNIPDYIKDISKSKDNIFINPYYYFLYGEGKELTHTLKIDNFITTKANVPINKGVTINQEDITADTSFYNNYVNNSFETWKNATFQYYKNNRRSDISLQNTPTLAKHFYEEYSQKDYNKNSTKKEKDRVKLYFTNSSSPGETFGYDSLRNRLWFKNPESNENNLRKENVGIKTRHGFTYGKYTFKIKMAELLNRHNIWTGLTNAIWMVSDDFTNNSRRKVNDIYKGYMPYYGAGKDEQRVNQITYSEIDFEIVKAAQYWPSTSYSDKKERKEPKSNSDKVMVTCTNWDMACMEPSNFDVGVNKIQYEDKEFSIHRWDHWYNALTSKVPEKDDELFANEFYYFQIEWTPSEIIWRIGPEKGKLRVVGYMNDKVTSIPNNQMLCIITQEFHHSDWWPNSPFLQENIPFLGEDLKGYLYSLEIE